MEMQIASKHVKIYLPATAKCKITRKYHSMPTGVAVLKMNVAKDQETLELSYTVGGNNMQPLWKIDIQNIKHS